MLSRVYLINGHELDLDEFATKAVLKAIHKQDLSNSLAVINIADVTGKFKYTIPMCNIVYIQYGD